MAAPVTPVDAQGFELGTTNNPLVTTGGGAGGSTSVTGNVASGTADSGAPVKIGGVFNTTAPTLTNGQRGDVQMTSTGQVHVVLWGSPTAQIAGSGTTQDGITATSTATQLRTLGYGLYFNGTTWDRVRGDLFGAYNVCVPSTAAATALVPVAATVLVSGLVLKASAGNLYGLNVVNGALAGYVMLFNSTTVPADGVVTPLKVFQLAANGAVNMNFEIPIRFSTGISVAFSTTGPFTKTASATAFISGDIT